MSSRTPLQENQRKSAESSHRDFWVLAGIATAFAITHTLTNGQYGFHRDELQFLSDARHLDWGYVAYPPLTPFLEHIGLALFGLSLIGLRLFSVVAQASVILVTGLMTRDLGGGRPAQIAAALSVGLSPVPVFEATEFQYTSFEFLAWVLVSWFVIRLLKTEDQRWWVPIGIAIGFGLETKYSIVFFIAGVLGGMFLSWARRSLRSVWFWAGVAVALLLFLPNFLWLIRHDFISYRFLQHIHARDVDEGRAEGFLRYQFLYCVNLFAAPIWVTGLMVYLGHRRYRMLAWMYLIPLALFWIGKGRFYYMAAAYPMLLAMGTAAGERWIGRFPRWVRQGLTATYFAGLVAAGSYAVALLVPIATHGPLRDFALRNNGDLREEIGWNELVKTVASIRDSLPESQRENFGILVGNYGEQGAIEMLGSPYHLPAPISLTNSAWLRGYPAPPPSTLIVVGVRKDEVHQIFSACRWAGHNRNTEGVRNEESQFHPDIFVCGPPLDPWPVFWRKHRSFG